MVQVVGLGQINLSFTSVLPNISITVAIWTNYCHGRFQDHILSRVCIRKGRHVWAMDKKGYILKNLGQFKTQLPPQNNMQI